LIAGVGAFEFDGDGFVDVGDRLRDAFAEVAVLHAVAKFPRFVFAGARAAGHDGTADGAAGKMDFGFDGGIAAGIKTWRPKTAVMVVRDMAMTGCG
jgi:hypothetical protein